MNKLSTSDEIGIFVRVVERGSFAAAAEETGLTPSGVSKAVTRLEDRLGVKLLQRTTRRLMLTAEGELLLARGREILAAIESTEAEVMAARGKPRGTIRINVGTAYAKHRLAPLMPEFRRRYPEIDLNISVADRRVDVIGEQIDVAIRIGQLTDSTLVARRLEEAKRVIAASPGYLARSGEPRQPSDLADHVCLAITGFSRLSEWPLKVDGRVRPVVIKPAMICDNADILAEMALAGTGIVRLGSFVIDDALADGRLKPVLVDCHVSETVPITALMPPGRQHLPRVRAFVDFLVEKTRERQTKSRSG
jgi:DNA-binding transcriptional LysR family regulator